MLKLTLGALAVAFLVAATNTPAATQGPVTWGANTYYPDAGIACVLLDAGLLVSDPVGTSQFYKVTCQTSSPAAVTLQVQGSTDPQPSPDGGWLNLPSATFTCQADAGSNLCGDMQSQGQVGTWSRVSQSTSPADGGALCCTQFGQ